MWYVMTKTVIIKEIFFLNNILWQIEAAKYKDSKCVGIYRTLVHPDNIEKIPNISISLREGLECAPSFDEVIKTLETFIEDYKVQYV